MADLTKTVEIIFGGKDNTENTFRTLEYNLFALRRNVDAVTAPLASATTAIAKLDAALMAAAIGGMAYAISKSSEFNNSFAQIATAVTATGPDLENFRTDVLNYAGTSVKSLSDINAALYSAAQAGIDYTQSIDFISKAEELAVANKANLNTTVELLTGTMNAYGFKLEDLGHINDVFFMSTLIGNQTIDELGTSMGNVVGIAANAGVSFEELSAAIATLTAKGMTTETAITAVKGIITAIISPSKEAAAAAEKLGLNFSLTEMSARGFSGMLHEIMEKTDGSKEQMIRLISEVRAMNGALMLTGDGMRFFDDALGKTAAAIGVAKEKYKIMVETFEAQTQMLKNIALISLVEIGTRLEPAAAKIAGAFGSLLANIHVSINEGAFDELFRYLDDTGTRIADWLKGVSSAFPEALRNVDFSGLTDAFQRVSDAMKDFIDGGMDLTNPEQLSSVIQEMTDSIESLVDVSRGIVEAFTPFINVTRDAVREFNAMDSSTKELMGNVLGLSVAYKMLGPAATIAMLALSSDSQDGATAMRVFFAAFENGVNAIKVGVTALGLIFANATLYVAEFLDALPGYDNTAGVARAQERVNALSVALAGYNKDLEASSLRVGSAIAGSDVEANKFKQTVLTTPTDVKTNMMLAPKIDPLATEETQWKLAQAFFDKDKNQIALYTTLQEAEVQAAKKKLAEAIPSKREVVVGMLADEASVEKVGNLIIEKFPNGMKRIVSAEMTVDEWNLRAVGKKIEDTVPTSKVMEIQAKVDETRTKEMSAIVQKSIEWDAKVNIAQIEKAGKIVIATFASIDNTINSTGNTISSLVGSYVNAMGRGGTSVIEGEIQAESRRRDAAIVMQQTMTDTQVAYLKQVTQNLKDGKALIEIDGKGLQPHLEAFMFEILKAIQVKANIEGMKFLVGTT